MTFCDPYCCCGRSEDIASYRTLCITCRSVALFEAEMRIVQLKEFTLALAERVAAQSELLSKRANRAEAIPDTRTGDA